jgi:hypothetical protein
LPRIRLYAKDKQFDKALHIYLKLKRGNVFELITKHDLFDSIQDKIKLLMQFDDGKGRDTLNREVGKDGKPVPPFVNTSNLLVEHTDKVRKLS